jgi:hypothetical protein
VSLPIETIIDHRITLSYAAFDVLYCGECGEDAVKPGGLEGLSPGATYGDRLRLVREVLADLRSRGLAAVDTPAPELLETIRLLHDPHRRVYGWYAVRDGDGELPGSFHIAESDDHAVLAQYENDRIVLEPVPWNKVYSTVLEFPPPAEPVAGDEIVVPLDTPPSEPPTAADWLDSTSEQPQRSLAQIDRDRVREFADPAGLWFAMQLFTARKDPHGKEIVCEFPLNYYAGNHGALMTVHKRPDGESEPQLHMIPATRAAFLHAIQSL